MAGKIATKFIFILLLLIPFNVLIAIPYYIDYEQGRDDNSGTDPNNAWKHCPGDPNAGGISAGTILTAGDIVYFKGGVVYQGDIRINRNGSEGNPITFKGDGWGTGKAIIDGADRMDNVWTLCASPDSCFGNLNYHNIYYTQAPANFNFFSGFYEDNNFLWFSQDPNPSDPFLHDNISEFYVVPGGRNLSRTQLIDSSYFIQPDPDFWDGAYIIAWRIPNVTSTKPVTSYNPNSHTVTFDDLGGDVYTDRNSYYAVLNHISIIDRPGEYCYDVATNRIYLWPLNSDDPNSHIYSVKKRQMGIVYSGRKNIVIEGFIVQNFVLGIRSDNSNTENIVIRNNEVRNLRSDNWYAIQMNGKNITVENNFVQNCNRSVGILAAGENLIVRNNYIKRTSRQGIWFMGVTHGQIIGNIVEDINGTHSNAISVYLYNKDILVAGNRVLDSEISFTFEGDDDYPDNHLNMTVYNNYFGSDAHSWGAFAKDIKIINNIFREGLFFSDSDTLTVSVNNIFHGGGDADIRSNNIYTDFGWWQSSRYGWSLRENEIDWTKKNVDSLYRIIDSSIYYPDGSQAIDGGVDPTQYLPITLFPDYNFFVDLHGNSRPSKRTWDVGPVESVNADRGVAQYCELLQNFPNPFNPGTKIGYEVSEKSNVLLEVFDILGRRIAVLVDQIEEKGYHQIEFDGSKYATGVYLYRLRVGRFSQCRRMVLLK